MILWLFFCLSAVTTIIYIQLASVGFSQAWKAVLVFAAAFLAFNVIYLSFLAVVSIFISTKPLRKQSLICRWGVAGVAGMACGYCWMRTHISGEDKLPKNSRFLVVSNHRSGFDPLVFMSSLSAYNIAFISKQSNLNIPVLGRIGYGAGCLPIDRENNREALKTINQAAEYIENDFCSMGIFPEGTRNHSKELLPFKAGAFKIAKKANVPVVIASVKGTESWKSKLLRGGSDVYLDILEVIPAESVAEMTTRELSDRAVELIEANLNKA